MKNKGFDCKFNICEGDFLLEVINEIINNSFWSVDEKMQMLKEYGIDAKSMVNLRIDLCKINSQRGDEIINSLMQKWNNECEEISKCICDSMQLNFDELNISFDCRLHFAGINKIDYKKNIIYLDCNNPINEIFEKLIIMISKIVLFQKFVTMQKYEFDTTYVASNKILMFLEIAIDAIINGSELIKICSNPSYKYFYNININGINIMKEFRKLYAMVPIDAYLTHVYMFVRRYQKTFANFKTYLYY